MSRWTVILRGCLPAARSRNEDPAPRGCRLIEAVFTQLHAEQPDNVEYKVVRLADGVSFVHVSSADTPDGSNPLPELAAFKEFGRDSAARVATAPVPTAADIIGSSY